MAAPAETPSAPALDLVRVTLGGIVEGLAANPARIGLQPSSPVVPHLARLGAALRALDRPAATAAFCAATGAELLDVDQAAFDEEAAWARLLDRMREEFDRYVARVTAGHEARATEVPNG